MNRETTGGKCSILIVEDEPIVAKDLQQTLREMNYDAYAIASSAEDAIKRAAERCPDLVLMDIRIKGARDGIQTAEILRQQFGVSVVYLTAHADEATIERAAKTAPYGYLLKPIKSAELRSTIEVAAYKQKLDKSVRERERWFSTALDSVSDAVVTVDLAGKVTYMNAAAEALIGASAESAIGRTADEVLRVLEQSSAGPMTSLETTPHFTLPTQPEQANLQNGATGEQPANFDSVAPIMDEGHPLGAVMVFRDVREKQKLQKQLEFADRLTSLGTMAAGTAHELNNPLSVVVTNAGFISEELLQHRVDLKATMMREITEKRFTRIFEALGDLQAAASRMARIIADLRAFSRPIDHSSQIIDLRRCVEWAVRTTAHEFQHRAQLRQRIEKAPMIVGESARLEQVLINLLVNAAHAITPGHAERNEVCISLRTDERGRAVIEVRDTGEGMRPEIVRRIFEPFFTTKPAGCGTGLGLSICHGIVKSLGGDIEVASELGKSTTFTVSLPAAPPQDETAPIEETPIETGAARGHILVIDDEKALLRAMQRILEDENHTVMATESAMDALAMIERGDHYDLILSDLMMPTMTGVDFYETLLARNPMLARSMIFVTGGAITAKVDAFLNSVPNHRLEKPFKAAQLREIVQKVLAQRPRMSVAS